MPLGLFLGGMKFLMLAAETGTGGWGATTVGLIWAGVMKCDEQSPFGLDIHLSPKTKGKKSKILFELHPHRWDVVPFPLLL